MENDIERSPKSSITSTVWKENISAADQGNAKAQLSIAGLYYAGKGVTQNYAQAFKYGKMSADQGYAKARV